MAHQNIIGRAQAWKDDADGPYTSAEVIVGVNSDADGLLGSIEITCQIGTKRESLFLTVDAEELMLAILRVRSKE